MTPRRTALTAAALVTPALIAAMLVAPTAATAAGDLEMGAIGRYVAPRTPVIPPSLDQVRAESHAVLGNRLYSTNHTSLDIVDISDPSKPVWLKEISLSAYGEYGITSVAASKGLVAVAIPATDKSKPGTVVILDPEGVVLATALVGALPDMVTFDEDGERVLVANEGEPVSYTPKNDPEGTVSIISLRGLNTGDDRCEVEDDDDRDDDDREDDDRDDDDRDDDDRDDDDRDDESRPTASPVAQDSESAGGLQQAIQDDEDDDDSRGGRGTRSRGDDDRGDDSRPTASPVATAPAAAIGAAVPIQPASGDEACDDDDRDDDKRKDRPSTAPSTGTPTAAATTAVVPAAPVVLTAATVDFKAFNVDGGTRKLHPAVRIFGPGATVAEDLEPEYITVADDRAFVTLQENNAIAEIDIDEARVTAIRPLGDKDHSLPASALLPPFALDPSDKNGIAIANWPVFGMRMPDAIASFTVQGKTYLLTANEGDARDYPGLKEEAQVKALTLDSATFPSFADLQKPEQLGNLTVSTVGADTDGDSDVDRLLAFGGRSLSVWSADGTLQWDSGDLLEQATKVALPLNFNANNTSSSLDNRSDNKGPEPEGVAVGKIDGRTYAFVGLERIGGMAVFDVTNPTSPAFVEYVTTRDFAKSPTDGSTDSGPEVMSFVSAEDSPNGKPLVVMSNEVSGTIVIWSPKP